MSEYKTLQVNDEFGQSFPWSELKKKTQYVAILMDEIAKEGNENIDERLVNRVSNCSRFLTFGRQTKNSPLVLQKANYCNNRFCYTCNALKARRTYYKLLHIVDEMMWRNEKEYDFLHITLTVKNVKGDEIRDMFNKMGNAWQKVMNLVTRVKNGKGTRNNTIYKIGTHYEGYFRSYEGTYNKWTKDYHPHMHIIFAMNKMQEGVTHEELQALWKKYMKLDYEPEVNIDSVYNNKGFDICQSVACVAKYMAKGINIDFQTIQKEEAKDVLRVLSVELANLPTITFQGIFKEYNELIKTEESADIVPNNINEDNLEEVMQEAERYSSVDYDLIHDNMVKKRESFQEDYLFGCILLRKIKRYQMVWRRKNFIPKIIEKYRYDFKTSEYVLFENKK